MLLSKKNKTNIHQCIGISILTGVACLGSSTVFAASNSQSATYAVKVNQAVWSKNNQQPYQKLDNSSIPAYLSNIVFIRPRDNNSVQTSINIGVDGKFQTSLQGGHYSQTLTCAGKRYISAEITGQKNNNLTDYAHSFQLAPQESHYFYIQLDTNQQPQIKQITEASALKVLQRYNKQTHQISRVTPDCSVSEALPLPITSVNEIPSLN